MDSNEQTFWQEWIPSGPARVALRISPGEFKKLIAGGVLEFISDADRYPNLYPDEIEELTVDDGLINLFSLESYCKLKGIDHSPLAEVVKRLGNASRCPDSEITHHVTNALLDPGSGHEDDVNNDEQIFCVSVSQKLERLLPPTSAPVEFVKSLETLKNNTEGKPVVMVPTSLFAGKTPMAACEALRVHGSSDDVIAYILVEKLRATRELTGKLLDPSPNSADKIKKHGEKNPKTYRNTANKLLLMSSNYSILFD